jgi:hypothetical protein
MKLTNEHNLERVGVEAIKFWDTSHDAGADYSITQLLDSPRVRLLREAHDDELVEDVQERFFALLGSGVHKSIEFALEGLRERDDLDPGMRDWIDGVETERRMWGELDGVTFSGQMDVYDKSLNAIIDFKAIATYERISKTAQKERREDREEQLNAYAWLARHNGLQVDAIGAMLFMRDWKRNQFEANYPEVPITTTWFDLWSDDKAEDFLRQRIAAHENAKQELPNCTPREQWRSATTYAVMPPLNGQMRQDVVAIRARDPRTKELWTVRGHALAWMMANAPAGAWIEERSKPGRCAGNYCSVSNFCTQYAAMKT